MANGLPNGNGGVSIGRGHLWDSWVRVASSFVLGGLSAVFFLGGKSRDLNDLLVWKSETKLVLEALQSNGTNRSRWTNEEQQREIDGLVKKVDEIDKNTQSIGSIQARVQHLENLKQ